MVSIAEIKHWLGHRERYFWGVKPKRLSPLSKFFQYTTSDSLLALDKQIFHLLGLRSPSIFISNILDYSVPEKEQMDEILEFINKEIAEGKKVTVCCHGGHGRTGTVLAIWCATKNKKIEDPVSFVRKYYCQKAIEGLKQEKFIFDYLGKVYPSWLKEKIEEEEKEKEKFRKLFDEMRKGRRLWQFIDEEYEPQCYKYFGAV